jgi:CheY-like chemotaxis protein
MVVMDIAMPRMDGLEATKRIKELRPSTKVVLISGNDRPPVNSAADGFLAKPFRIDELCQAVQSVLSDNQSSPRVA